MSETPAAKPPGKLPASCGVCAFLRTGEPELDHQGRGRCHRHAPGTFEPVETVVIWPVKRGESRCGQGEVVGDGTALVSCMECAHWWQPGGKPIAPRFPGKRDHEWWGVSGYCTAAAPFPSGEPSHKPMEPGVTHGEKGGCGDGERLKPKPS